MSGERRDCGGCDQEELMEDMILDVSEGFLCQACVVERGMVSQDRTQCYLCGTLTLDEQLEGCRVVNEHLCRICHVMMHQEHVKCGDRAARRDMTLLKDVESGNFCGVA